MDAAKRKEQERSRATRPAYAPFGETYAQSGTADLSFTGQNADTVSGDYDFLYREYSNQGRWASPDPAGLAAVDPTDPQSWNRYAYVENSPLNFVDPLGLCGGGPGVVTSTINGVPTGPGQDFSSGPCGHSVVDVSGGACFIMEKNGMQIYNSCASSEEPLFDRGSGGGGGGIRCGVPPFLPCGGPKPPEPAPPNLPCTPSIFDPNCKRPTCRAVFEDASEAADPFGGNLPYNADQAAKTGAQALVVNRIVSRGLVQPFSSSFVRKAVLGGEVAATAIAVLPVLYQGVAGLYAEAQARNARTCRTAWESK